MGSRERLFHMVRDSLETGLSDRHIINLIKADESLLEASDSYCDQCGWCCGYRCANMTMDGERVYCMLHDSGSYPNGKKIPSYGDAKSLELDPAEWTKPLLCHTFGPHLGLLYNLRKESLSSKCRGSLRMTKDYERFIRKSLF